MICSQCPGFTDVCRRATFVSAAGNVRLFSYFLSNIIYQNLKQRTVSKIKKRKFLFHFSLIWLRFFYFLLFYCIYYIFQYFCARALAFFQMKIRTFFSIVCQCPVPKSFGNSQPQIHHLIFCAGLKNSTLRPKVLKKSNQFWKGG